MSSFCPFPSLSCVFLCLSLPLSLSFPCIHSVSRGSPLHIQLGKVRSTVNFSNGSGLRQTVCGAFWMENHVPCSADQVCIVIHIGRATYGYGTHYPISQKRSCGMVSSWPRKCRYGIPSRTVALPDVLWYKAYVWKVDRMAKHHMQSKISVSLKVQIRMHWDPLSTQTESVIQHKPTVAPLHIKNNVA